MSSRSQIGVRPALGGVGFDQAAAVGPASPGAGCQKASMGRHRWQGENRRPAHPASCDRNQCSRAWACELDRWVDRRCPSCGLPPQTAPHTPHRGCRGPDTSRPAAACPCWCSCLNAKGHEASSTTGEWTGNWEKRQPGNRGIGRAGTAAKRALNGHLLPRCLDALMPCCLPSMSHSKPGRSTISRAHANQRTKKRLSPARERTSTSLQKFKPGSFAT